MAQMMMARAAGKRVASVLSFAAMPILLAPLLGPVIAGAILQFASWPWLFLVNLPVGVLAIVLAVLFLHGIRVLPDGKRRRGLWGAAKAIFDEDFAGEVLSFDNDAADMYAEIIASRRSGGKPHRPVRCHDRSDGSVPRSQPRHTQRERPRGVRR